MCEVEENGFLSFISTQALDKAKAPEIEQV